jgi:hypothetical protein
MRLALALLAALALSGCHEYWYYGPEPDDPPVHQGGQDIGASPGSVAATGQAFRGRADGQLASRIVYRHGFVKSMTSWARFIGEFKSDLSDSPLASGQWHGRFKSVRNRATGRYAMKGLVLVTFDDAPEGRACLKLTNRGKRAQNRRPKKPGLGNVTVVGGEGGAQTLYGTASARVRLARDNSLRLRGRVKQHRGAARGLTPACAKLERKFGLAPLG